MMEVEGWERKRSWGSRTLGRGTGSHLGCDQGHRLRVEVLMSHFLPSVFSVSSPVLKQDWITNCKGPDPEKRMPPRTLPNTSLKIKSL